jgi:hypothetical protein
MEVCCRFCMNRTCETYIYIDTWMREILRAIRRGRLDWFKCYAVASVSVVLNISTRSIRWLVSIAKFH